MSKGGSTQLRATGPLVADPAARRERERRPRRRASRPHRRRGPTTWCHPAPRRSPGARAAPATPAPAPAKTEPWSSSDCGWRTPSTMAPDSTRGHPEHGQRRRQPGAPDRQVGEGEPDQAGEQARHPRQHQQRTVAVDRRQRGEQVLPAEDRLVGDTGEGRGAREHGGVAQRAQAQRPAEQEEQDQADHHGRDDGPARGARQVGHHDARRRRRARRRRGTPTR